MPPPWWVRLPEAVCVAMWRDRDLAPCQLLFLAESKLKPRFLTGLFLSCP